MVRLFVRHPVTDIAKWKQAYDDFDAERGEMGVTAHGAFQSAEDPNDVTVYHDFESLEAARAFADSPRLREAMTAAGVIGEPTMWFTTKA